MSTPPPVSAETDSAPVRAGRRLSVLAFAGAFLGLPAWLLATERILQGHLASDLIVAIETGPILIVGLAGLALLMHTRLRAVGVGLVSGVAALVCVYALLVAIILTSDTGFMS